MSWINLTPADVEGALNALETKALATGGSDGAPADRLPGIIADVCLEVRGYVASCTRNQLSATPGAIPAACKRHALVLVKWALISSTRRDPTEAQRDEYKAATRYFERIASCDIRVEPPADPVPNETPPQAVPHGAEVLCDVPSRTGRRRMSGL